MQEASEADTLSESEGADDPKVATLLRRLGAWETHEGRFAKCNCSSCSKISPWGCLLKQLEPKLCERIQTIAYATTNYDRYFETRDCVAVQCLWYIFAWLADQLSHPLLDKGVFKGHEAAWPNQSITELPDSVAKYLYGASIPNIDPSLLDAAADANPGREDAHGTGAEHEVAQQSTGSERATEKSNRMQREFVSLCKTSAAQLLGELEACQCPSMETLNAFSLQSLEVRRELAWSIPCSAALALIASYSPLIEVGCGTGFWAELLRGQGADVRSYNSAEWRPELAADGEGGGHEQCGVDPETVFGEVLSGGWEVLLEHPDRTLVLMWPDYMGKGTFGMECLENYAGEYLVLVGEWQGRTWGSYLARLSAHGQSFSSEFQEAVAAAFEEVKVQRIPNWPLFMDCVMVFKRRSLEDLIAEQPDQGPGPDLLTAFLSGAYDPFAGLGDEPCSAAGETRAGGTDIEALMAAAAEDAEEGEALRGAAPT